MPRNDEDLNDAVMGQFHGLIGNMRAKRLARELPAPEQKDPMLNDEQDAGHGDDDGDALEQMLGDYDNDDDAAG